jgi:hypothetical protein
MDYRFLGPHRLMIRDSTRTEAFARAIEETIKPGSVVLDVGAGTGIFSLMAARAGAARVYAVERTSVAGMVGRLAYINKLADVIRVIRQDVRAVTIPEKVDFIISEWMGSIGVDENMLGPVLWARDHFLKSKGVLIPRTVTAMAAPIATSIRPDTGFFFNRPYGFDLTPLAEPSLHELLMIRRCVQPSDLAAPSQALWKTDVASDSPDVVRKPYSAHLKFSIKKDALVSAIGAWFEAELTPTIALTNAPDAQETHWGQLMLPLDKQLKLKAGDVLELKVTTRCTGPGPLHFTWLARVNDGSWQSHDTLNGTLKEQVSPILETPRSKLSSFLADMAIDPDMLSRFFKNPDAILEKHDVSKEHREVLKSLDLNQIQEALYESRSEK